MNCVFLRGLWNVPFVMNAVLVQGHRMSRLRNAHSHNPDLDPDMSFCQRARDLVSSKDSSAFLFFVFGVNKDLARLSAGLVVVDYCFEISPLPT